MTPKEHAHNGLGIKRTARRNSEFLHCLAERSRALCASKGRCIGLIGGLGVGATVHYYRELAKAHELEQQALQLVMVHADLQRVFRHVGADDAPGLARYLAELIGRVKAAGADVAAVSAVMPHICVGELIERSALPLVNLLQCVEEEIQARRLHRVAVFGTRFTVERDLFGRLENVEVVTPKEEEVNYVHDTYSRLAWQGLSTEEDYSGLTLLAHRLCEREGLDAILLAGTDLSLIFNESNTDFPHVDCARAHIRGIMRSLGSNVKLTSTEVP